MMRMKTGLSPITTTNFGGAAADERSHDWELRPCGMLVQKRNPDSDRINPPPPNIRVRVKFGSIYHEISINSQATFGELKKMLSGPTGLHHQDQKLFYKNKERESKTFLDITGVKDKSKLVLIEDPLSQEKRLLEMRKTVKMEKAAKSISEISLEVDKLAGQVLAFDAIISKGGSVEEKNLVNLIEVFMNTLLKLDGITADGDVKLQRKMQVRRVQKYVETLDMLKVKNSKHVDQANVQKLSTIQEQQFGVFSGNQAREQETSESFVHLPVHQQYQQKHQRSRDSVSVSAPVVVTTKWETFDNLAPLVPVPSSASGNNAVQPRFSWEFFE